jgi:DNA-binding transcriptional LysR family regulator
LRIWRFADLTTRLEFLLGGFGWCNMPRHMVDEHIKAGRLKELEMKTRSSMALPMHVVYDNARPPGRAGRWFIDELRKRLAKCVPAYTGANTAI